MQIKKSCQETPPPTFPTVVELSTVTIGTVLRYGNHAAGPYMRTSTGLLDLSSGYHFTYNSYSMLAYKELPKAFLVTGEE